MAEPAMLIDELLPRYENAPESEPPTRRRVKLPTLPEVRDEEPARRYPLRQERRGRE
jgi:hypothetical protein